MTLITLVRHGTTEWIEQGRLHGVLDSPLSARGREESLAAAAALKGQRFDAFYTSPLGRARETAAIIGEAIGMQAKSLDSLREMNFGWMEGGRNFNLATDSPIIRMLRRTWITTIVGVTGEGMGRFGARVARTGREIARRHPDQHVLAVVHMGIRNRMIAHLVDDDPTAFARYDGWPACAMTEIEVPPEGRAKLIHLTISEHLNVLRSSQ